MRAIILRLTILLTGLWLAGAASAQPADTARLFSLGEFLTWVLDQHPVAARAGLLDDQARAAVRSARGAFDPKLYADWQQKSFDGKEYYTIGETGLKIPTWFGLEFKGAFLNSGGQFLNPENQLPAAGQAVLGVKATLGQGLFIDQRRASLKQAQLLEKASEAGRRGLLNDLILDARKAYWDWTAAYNQLLVYQRALAVAEQRFRGVVESYRQGDKPAVDTLETLIQVQAWQLELNEAGLAYRQAGLALSNFLWLDGQVPVEVTDSIRPPAWEETGPDLVPPLADFLEPLAARHPELIGYQVDLQQLDIDRRLAAEQFKPRLDVEYNFLGNGLDFSGSGGEGGNGLASLFLQNYKWGIQFQFPLFLRKEQGKLQLTKIKMIDVDYKLQQKHLELTNKVRQYYVQLATLRNQIDLSRKMVAGYQGLLNAELRKFAIGESSIFLLNSREQKLIEGRLKLAKLEGEYRKIHAGLDWAAGGSW